jgi:hypothetical protein
VFVLCKRNSCVVRSAMNGLYPYKHFLRKVGASECPATHNRRLNCDLVMRLHHLQYGDGVHDLLTHVHIRLRPASLAQLHTVAQRAHLILPRGDVLDDVDPANRIWSKNTRFIKSRNAIHLDRYSRRFGKKVYYGKKNITALMRSCFFFMKGSQRVTTGVGLISRLKLVW